MSKQVKQTIREVKVPNSTSRKKPLQDKSKRIFLGILTGVIVYIAISMIVYAGSLPTTYQLSVNDISDYDINAPRTIIDKSATRDRAEEAKAAVSSIMVKNEKTTAVSLANIEVFLDIVSSRRERLYFGDGTTKTTPAEKNESQTTPEDNEENDQKTTEKTQNNILTPSEDEIVTAATSMVSQINQSFDINFDINDARQLLSMENTRFDHFSSKLRDMSNIIMQQALEEEQLTKTIEDTINKNSEEQVYFTADNEIIEFVLNKLLKPNVEYDAEATNKAKEDAAKQIENNPIMINQGVRIVSQGDLITEDIYNILEELNLTDSGQFDWYKFAGIALMNVILLLILVIFFRFFKLDVLFTSQTIWSLIMALLIPLIISFYLSDTYPLSATIYFSTVIICAYFDLKTSMVVSAVLVLASYPMTSFHPYYLPVTMTGCLVAAFFARKISREDNYVKLIIATTLASLSMVLALGIVQKDTMSILTTNVISTAISAMISVIAAIGVMPIFEMLFNTVSPIKIIELSQPGHPLLKRLFTEAPGTSQHSMMVANLADSGAEAIGADATLARVGAYYHDIGKLENPLMFTENQVGENPHDRLTPEESCRIITAHTEDGLKLGRKYRLPEPVLKMIHEHHGTTVLQYFYHKASQIAEKEGKEAPNKDAYRYHNPLPSFRESAVLMLADSVEAAMKSSDIDNLPEAEKFMRNIFKIKIDQDQLFNSGLSFHDIELILQAFLQVYAGQFHSRIKYPDTDEDNLEVAVANE